MTHRLIVFRQAQLRGGGNFLTDNDLRQTPSRKTVSFTPANKKSPVQQLQTSFYQADTALGDMQPNDSFLREDDAHLFVLDGVVFNSDAILAETKTSDLLSATQQTGLRESVKQWRGDFSGFCLNKTKNTVEGFTDHWSIHSQFYYMDDQYFITASNVPLIVEALRDLGVSYSPDFNGLYYLLTYGYMMESTTLVCGISKLKPGHTLTFDCTRWTLQTDCYWRVDNTQESRIPYSEMLEQANVLFRNAVSLGIEKDRSAGKISRFDLSAGLDCRTTLFVAEDLGCCDKLVVNVGDPDGLDYRIPPSIMKHLTGTFIQIPRIDGRAYLNHLEDWFNCTGGLTEYGGGGGVSFDQKYGMSHNGAESAASISGDRLHHKTHVLPQPASGIQSALLYSRIEKEVQNIVKNYENEELFRFACAGANLRCPNGGRDFSFCSTPYINPDLVDFMLTVPPHLRWKKKFMLDLICTYYPKEAQTVYQQTLLTIEQTRKYGNSKLTHFKKNCYRAWQRLMGKGGYSHTPILYWYQTDEKFRRWLNETYSQYSGVLADYPELHRDVENLFHNQELGSKRVNSKLRAISLLYAFYRYFG